MYKICKLQAHYGIHSMSYCNSTIKLMPVNDISS